MTSSTTSKSRRNSGLGRIIIAVYGIFALAATARAGFQLLTDFSAAPEPYLLSAFAAVVYIVATIALAIPGARAWWTALVAVLIELVGVIAIGAYSFVAPEHFPEATVWSHFGEGYGYVPVVLPVIGLIWLLTHRPGADLVDDASAAGTRS
ncbi:MAG: hypothetical protein ACTHZ5_03650 [Micrococcaceae bacterium]